MATDQASEKDVPDSGTHAPGYTAKLVLLFVSVYRYLISPLLPSRCRYYPTCSAYAQEAVVRYGAWTGVKLTVRRLMSCHPWGGHGYDPVPELNSSSHSCCRRNP